MAGGIRPHDIGIIDDRDLCFGSAVFFFFFVPKRRNRRKQRQAQQRQARRQRLLRLRMTFRAGFTIRIRSPRLHLSTASSDPCGNWHKTPSCWPDLLPAGRPAPKNVAGGRTGSRSWLIVFVMSVGSATSETGWPSTGCPRAIFQRQHDNFVLREIVFGQLHASVEDRDHVLGLEFLGLRIGPWHSRQSPLVSFARSRCSLSPPCGSWQVAHPCLNAG